MNVKQILTRDFGSPVDLWRNVPPSQLGGKLVEDAPYMVKLFPFYLGVAILVTISLFVYMWSVVRNFDNIIWIFIVGLVSLCLLNLFNIVRVIRAWNSADPPFEEQIMTHYFLEKRSVVLATNYCLVPCVLLFCATLVFFFSMSYSILSAVFDYGMPFDNETRNAFLSAAIFPTLAFLIWAVPAYLQVWKILKRTRKLNE